MKAIQREAAAINISGLENISMAGFCNFCKKNIPLLIAVTFTLFFTYGIRLFWYSIGIDAELFMADRLQSLSWSLEIGRFGYVLLSTLLHLEKYNPFTAVFIGFCLMWFFTISWCYILAIFGRDTGRNNRMIPFALVFMTSPVWATQFYFVHQIVEIALIISLCPYIIYMLYKGFLENKKRTIICGGILLVFIISVYQGIVPLFCCGVFACFLLLQGNSDYESKVYRKLALKLFLILVCALSVYFFIDRIIIPLIFHVERASYLDDMSRWGQMPFGDTIGIALWFFYLLMGPFNIVKIIVDPILARSVGAYIVESLGSISRVYGNVLLLPAMICFLISVIRIMRKVIPRGRRLLYLLAAIGIALCTVLLSLAGSNLPPMRSHLALPLVVAFMLFFLITTYKKKAAVIVVCLTLFSAAYQAQTSAQLYYSDQMRYNDDVRIAYELNNLILRAQDGNNLPVALAGKYSTAPRFRNNYFTGELIGHSFFGCGEDVSGSTRAGLFFMRTLGLNFTMPDEDQLERALYEAMTLPAFPDPGCVKVMPDLIVVRIAEELY